LPSGSDGLLGNYLCPNDPASLLAVTRAQTRASREAEKAKTVLEAKNQASAVTEQNENDSELG
jgi:hypothetical protein